MALLVTTTVLVVFLATLIILLMQMSTGDKGSQYNDSGLSDWVLSAKPNAGMRAMALRFDRLAVQLGPTVAAKVQLLRQKIEQIKKDEESLLERLDQLMQEREQHQSEIKRHQDAIIGLENESSLVRHGAHSLGPKQGSFRLNAINEEILDIKKKIQVLRRRISILEDKIEKMLHSVPT